MIHRAPAAGVLDRLRTPCRALALAALVAASSSTVAATETDTGIVIRTYDAGGILSPPDRPVALAAAARILQTAGLSVEWRACEPETRNAERGARAVPSSELPAPHCSAPLDRNELSIRFVRAPSSPRTPDRGPLGASLVDTAARGGALATVYVDRVTRLAAAARVDGLTLLGRTIAHEVGHLLLGTTKHARSGLMRAVWPQAVLRRDDPSDWQFMARDTQAMHDAVRGRTSGRLAAHLVHGD